MTPDHDLVLVVDFGAQYAQLIARRVREARVYSEIVPHTMPIEEMLAKQPAAIILSGGPSSVYEAGAPQLDAALFDAELPVFGICYGFQAMAKVLGGDVAHTGQREYGRTSVSVAEPGTLLAGLPATLTSWMSHGDEVVAAPDGFLVNANSPRATVAAFEHTDRKLAGVQWHPEVLHSEHGQRILEAFLVNIAGCRQTWTSSNIVEEQVELIRAQVGDARVISALSGGVDSAVSTALVQRAIGDQLTAVFVDHGLLREGEAEQVEKDYVEATGVDLKVVDARDQFLGFLAGVSDPEEKRKIIGREFIRVFEAAEREVLATPGPPVKFLVQGTLYPDVVESGGGEGAANIKSHHNVGGLPDDLEFSLIEPLRTLFKDEVRDVGRQLGIPEAIVGRHPFPGPGLAIRIVGAVDAERLAHPAPGRRDRPRGDHGSRPRRRDLAVPGRAAGRRTLGRRAGRRSYVRAPDRAAPGVERGRHDGRLEPPPVRRAGAHLDPHHQRGRRGQPCRARHHQQAARHDRMGVVALSC